MLGDVLLESCETESTHTYTCSTQTHRYTKSHKWDPMCLPRIEGSFSAYISGLSLGITLLESHWFMPAIRFMRKNRAIESQHGADLSRVGRNDNVRGREGWGVIEWDELKKNEKKRETTRRLSIDNRNAIAWFTERQKKICEYTESPKC